MRRTWGMSKQSSPTPIQRGISKNHAALLPARNTLLESNGGSDWAYEDVPLANVKNTIRLLMWVFSTKAGGKARLVYIRFRCPLQTASFISHNPTSSVV